MVQCDLVWLDHSPVRQSPRTILQTQLDRVAERGLVALAGTELEFIAFHTSYEDAARQHYHDLVPVNAVQRRLLDPRRQRGPSRCCARSATRMYAAGLDVESAKGECNFGQHEIGFLYADALTTADNHAVYKTVAKEIAAQQGRSITFLAKYDEREGSSCHIHLSLRGADGSDRVLGRRASGRSPLYDSLRRRAAGHDDRLHPAVRPQHQLLQALRPRQLRPHHDRLGH